MPESLTELLDQYEIATLQALLSSMGLKVQGRISKPDLIQFLIPNITTPDRVSHSMAGLSPAEREVIILLQRQGGQATRGAIRRRLADLNVLDTRETRLDVYSNQQPDHRKTDSHFMDEILAHLLASGLVFGLKTADPWGRVVNLTFRMVNEYCIPIELAKLLPPPPELPARLPVLPAPERILEGSARVFQRDLYLYWSYIHHNRVELIAKGALPKRHLTALNETLLQRETITTGQGEADFQRLVFLRAMLTQLELIKVDGTYLLAGPGEAFFGAEPLDRIRRSFESYLSGTQLNELAVVHPINSMGGRLIPAPDLLIEARKKVMPYLALSEGWTALDLLVERIRTVNYEFLLPRTYRAPVSQSYYYPISTPYAQYGNPLGWEWPFPAGLDEGEGWWRVEAQLIGYMVYGPLNWMGLTDLGFNTRETGPDSFCLTAPGRWLLANQPPPEIPLGQGQVIVQPDFTILAFDPISELVLFQLEHFAQRVSAERAILLRLTQSSVYAAQQTGWDASRIQSYLEELAHQPLPANIARTLSEWQKIHERIRIYPHVNLLHARQPADLDELTIEKKLLPLLKQALAPGVIALPPKIKLREVFDQLTRAGWQPTVTTKSAGLPPNSVEASADGRISFLQHAPGLYLRAHLARFGEEAGEGYRLTPESIRRATNAGLSAPELITELTKVLAQPLPAILEQHILAWSGLYGQVQLEPTRLLRFKDETALQHLLRDPEISSLLRKVRPADLEQIALVRAKDIEKLRNILNERGVEWKE